MPGAAKMKTFIVEVREVHVQMIEVEAVNKEEAVQRVSRGEGRDIDNTLEFSHRLGSEQWTVEEA